MRSWGHWVRSRAAVRCQKEQLSERVSAVGKASQEVVELGSDDDYEGEVEMVGIKQGTPVVE